MKAIGIIQNHPESANGPSNETFFFTGDEKRMLVDLFGEDRHPEVYVVEEHGGGERHMGNTSTLRYEDAVKQKTEYFNIPLEKRIGRVAELLCDRAHNLHGVLELYHENPRVHEIMEEIRKGAKYGLSIGVDAEKLPGGRLRNKKFTHVGLTKQPEYGGDPELTFDPSEPNLFGTWLHQAAISHNGMDEILATRYLSRPGMYAAKRTRDRINKRLSAAVPVSVGASRPQIDSAALIKAAPVAASQSSVPATATMSNGNGNSALPSIEPTMSSTIPGHFPNDPVLLAEKEQRRHAEERAREAQNKLDYLYENRERLIDALDAEDPSKVGDALRLQRELNDLFDLTGAWTTIEKRSKYGPMLLKVDAYVEKARPAFEHHLDETIPSKDMRNFYREAMNNPLEFGPVLTQVGASISSMNNMRKAEEQLKREQEENKRKDEELKKKEEELAGYRKRAREWEENTEALMGRRNGYSNTSLAPLHPEQSQQQQQQQQGVPVSAGATRYFGSANLSRREHTIADSFYADLAPRRESFKESPFSRTTFNDNVDTLLHNVAELARKYSRSKEATFDGLISKQ